jgi:hypothetical protein
MTMTGWKTLVAAALISTIPAASAVAQAPLVNPDASAAEVPNCDLPYGGALRHARGTTEVFVDGVAFGPAANYARAEISRGGPSFRVRHFDRHRHPSR